MQILLNIIEISPKSFYKSLEMASDIEILSCIEKLTLELQHAWKQGIPTYHKADVNEAKKELLTSLLHEYQIRKCLEENKIGMASTANRRRALLASTSSFKILRESENLGEDKATNIYLYEWSEQHLKSHPDKEKYLVSCEHDYRGSMFRKSVKSLDEAEKAFDNMVKKYSKSKVKANSSIETFKIYDPTQPHGLKSKEVKCKEEDLESSLKKHLGVPKSHESKLETPKKGVWVFKAGGKEYTVTKWQGD